MMKKKTGARHFTPFSLCGIGFFHNWIIFTGNGLSWERKYYSDLKRKISDLTIYIITCINTILRIDILLKVFMLQRKKDTE